MYAHVVAGQGIHSSTGRARIRPAVVRWLTDAGYKFAASPENPGIINVQVWLGRYFSRLQLE